MRGAGIIFIFLLYGVFTNSTKTLRNDSVVDIGCFDGTSGAFHPLVAVCSGAWIGHIRNASHLCARGWHVCSHRDKDRLKRVRWEEAVSLDGCFAFNAAQDGGTCQECRSNLEMDDLAGIGRGCPHQNPGQSSCITGGRIDVSCCVDTRLGNACSYRPGLASGVVCCKDQDFPPKLILTPPLTVQVTKGSNMSLTCGVSGNPNPVVLWYKDGNSLLNTNKRIFTFRTGTLIVVDVRSVDSGRYRCFARNNFGNVTTTTQVSVIEPNFGCADRSDQGLFFLPNVSACKGAWSGHIRRAKPLCSRGWRVCGVQDSRTLRRLSWQQATSVDGCYAYNAAVSGGKCAR
uniref:Ig-like domain-containing protein n=1 Tax=Strigamia maritima TaxID=126957 RepID=T1JH60_STRMM